MMENNIDLTKKIEAYLDNELSSEEHLAFEKQLKNDKKLRKEVEVHENIRRSFELQGEKQLKDQFENYYQKYKLKKKTIKIMWSTVAAAASILLFFTLLNNRNTTPIDDNNYITLDSIQVNSMEQHADSAFYEIEKENILQE